MLRLLALPIEMLRIAFYALQGLFDTLRARNRLNLEFNVLVNAPRDDVWQFSTADHMYWMARLCSRSRARPSLIVTAFG
ncbi:hypothetical protein XH98_13365 [Bradyrhizobium sp. CCBAU 51745]|uniref:hypothetical protein n=1 Tax=Bradyrhizobium sp. CCBAU 51745 TaxID=1325099 RepID=UPI002305A109|nr:hypothetical protein [Bradyrhizobium sp. CCBAU 51745]MDA9440097.1 hypothetical protein [Bradyrhizobium sp. CCBAU 51745]